jgi:excisionase family DNA binding protein
MIKALAILAEDRGRQPEKLSTEMDLPSSEGGEQEVMTVNELAQYLQVHRTTLYKLLKEKKIPAFRIGTDWRFSRHQISQWMMARHKLLHG